MTYLEEVKAFEDLIKADNPDKNVAVLRVLNSDEISVRLTTFTQKFYTPEEVKAYLESNKK